MYTPPSSNALEISPLTFGSLILVAGLAGGVLVYGSESGKVQGGFAAELQDHERRITKIEELASYLGEQHAHRAAQLARIESQIEWLVSERRRENTQEGRPLPGRNLNER